MDPQRRLLPAACLGGTAVTPLTDAFAQTGGPAGPAAAEGTAANASRGPDHAGRHNFDFFHGQWNVHNRRLKTWLAESDEWIEFEGCPVLVRAIRTQRGANEVNWEQAFSTDQARPCKPTGPCA